MPARLTDAQRYLRTITEAAWQSQAEQLAASLGWLAYHAPDNRPIRSRTGKTYVQNVRGGWPDLFAVRGRRAIALELKRETGTLEPAQHGWLVNLDAAGIEVDVLRPGEIRRLEAILRGEIDLKPLDLARLK